MRLLQLLTLSVSTLTTTLGAALLPACGPKDPADTEGASEATTSGATEASGTSGTGTTVVDPTGGPVTETTEGSGSLSATGTTEATDSETGVASNPTTADTEADTGIADPNFQASCTAACEHLIDCLEEVGPLGTCVEKCLMESSDPGRNATPACNEAILNFHMCIVETDCKEFADEPCAPHEEAIEEACGDGDNGCLVGVMPPSDGNCGLSFSCSDSDLLLLCEGDTCRCFENDVETTSCPAQMVCEGENWAAKLDEAAAQCCGFEL